MAAGLVCVAHKTPLLMPPDLRDWVLNNHLVHCIWEAIGFIHLREVKINDSGTGSRQYAPTLMLGLLIYPYATGTFSRCRVERTTSENVAVRLLRADLHPNHNSICPFRRANCALLKIIVEQVLAMAVQMRVLKVGLGALALDGTRILATASKHSAVRHGLALEQIEVLEKRGAELLSKAEAADRVSLEEGLTLPNEIARQQDPFERFRADSDVLKPSTKERYQQELWQFQAKEQERKEGANKSGNKPRGCPSQPTRRTRL